MIVARVVSSDANLIILDEVTSNMDAIAEYKIFEQIMQYVTDKMGVYISHKLSTTKNADKIYLFESDKIIEEGNHVELMKKGGKYREMFLVQAGAKVPLFDLDYCKIKMNFHPLLIYL